MDERQREFRSRLIAIMQDLQQDGVRDAEAMRILGRLASGLIATYRLKTWAEFKNGLPTAGYNQLVEDFRDQGNAYLEEGKVKAAYAIQLLAMSMVARTMNEPDLKQGVTLLDAVIERALRTYRRAITARTASH